MPKTSEVYKKLYHYTTWEGLQGILGTQTLWATNYKFLNDYSEIVLFREKLAFLISAYVRESFENLIKKSPKIEEIINEKGGLDQVVQHDTRVLVDAQYSALGDEIYILSFCGQHKDPKINNNGLLSQWRGYGAGGGAALVIDTKRLEEILALEGQLYQYDVGLIHDLIYSDDEQKFKNELSAEISVLVNITKQLFEHNDLNKKKEIDLSRGYLPFVKCISRYKHYGFKEENEVRVVLLPSVINQAYLEQARKDGITLKPAKEIKFRNKNGQKIPYIDLFNSTEIELPIEKIIIGPHKEKEARAENLHAQLSSAKIEITCSEIPYVC